MRKVVEALHGLRPVLLMILVQIIYTGMNIFYKVAANDGMSMRVLIAYRWILASAYTIPVALFFERKRPKFTWNVLWLAFLSGLFGGTLSQNLYVESLVLTSATFAAAISNLVPAVTLILAVSLGFEKLGIKTRVGKAKTLGTVIGIGGAMLITLYRGGFELKFWSTNVHLLKPNKTHQNDHISSNYILGSITAFGSCICYALWLIVQTKLSKIYPVHYTNAALTSLMASIQCVIFSLSTERDWSQWKLGWNLRLLTVFYSGIINSGLVLTFIAWCVYIRGAVFVASFSPLSLVLVAFFASLFLQEHLHIGSILGSALIVCGLYMVLWGQNRELKEKAKLVPAENENENDGKEKELIIEVVSHDSSATNQASLSKNLQNSLSS